MIFRQRFPVRDEHFGKNIVLDPGVNLKTDKGQLTTDARETRRFAIAKPIIAAKVDSRRPV